MHHILLFAISIIGSFFFNSSHIKSIIEYSTKEFGFDKKDGDAFSIILYTLIIYLVSCLVSWIMNYSKRMKNLREITELKNKIKEIKEENDLLKTIFAESMRGINHIDSNINSKHKARAHVNNLKNNLNNILEKIPENSLMLDVRQIFLDKENKEKEINPAQINNIENNSSKRKILRIFRFFSKP